MRTGFPLLGLVLGALRIIISTQCFGMDCPHGYRHPTGPDTFDFVSTSSDCVGATTRGLIDAGYKSGKVMTVELEDNIRDNATTEFCPQVVNSLIADIRNIFQTN